MLISDWSSDVCSSDLTYSDRRKLVWLWRAAGQKQRIDPRRALTKPALPEKKATGNLRLYRFQFLPHYYFPMTSSLPDRTVFIVSENGRASCRERVCQYV